MLLIQIWLMKDIKEIFLSNVCECSGIEKAKNFAQNVFAKNCVTFHVFKPLSQLREKCKGTIGRGRLTYFLSFTLESEINYSRNLRQLCDFHL